MAEAWREAVVNPKRTGRVEEALLPATDAVEGAPIAPVGQSLRPYRMGPTPRGTRRPSQYSWVLLNGKDFVRRGLENGFRPTRSCLIPGSTLTKWVKKGCDTWGESETGVPISQAYEDWGIKLSGAG